MMMRRFAKSENGAAMVEMTIVAPLLFARCDIVQWSKLRST